MDGIVKYTTEGGSEMTLSPAIVRRYLAPSNVTDQEVMMFLALCKEHRLNPFLREAYLLKYGDQPATITVGKDAITKRAFRNPNYRGHEAGLTIVTADNKLVRRDGSMLLEGEKLVGAWARVYVRDYEKPVFDEVSFAEYAGKKRDGSLNKTWASKPGTMIRKVALVHALREAFPEELNGMYDQAEMQVEEQPTEPIEREEAVEAVLADDFLPEERF